MSTLDPNEVLANLRQRKEKNEEIDAFLNDIDSACEKHSKHKNRMRISLSNFAKQHPKFKDLMYDVTNRGKTMPAFFFMCSSVEGEDNSVKARLANELLAAFSASLRMKKVGKGGCPFYQPSTHSQMLRTLLSAMKDHYDWHFTLDKSFDFIGGVSKVTTALFQARADNFDKFAKGNNKAKLSDEDFHKLMAKVKDYNEEDLHQHQKKLVILASLQTGLRGREHAEIEHHKHIEQDFFPDDHPLAGMMFYAFVG